MWIRHLSVSHWRGLDHELDDLSPGLNLVFGPNESGKSRLVEALRFALFESSNGRSAHKKALATWGMAPEKPRVTVEFELRGTRWKLEKEFLGTGHNTSLRSDTETLEGAEAESRLADLIGVGPGGRVELKPEDRGIWSLLWVDQGGSREAPVHNETSQTHIQDRLTREIGEVAAGERGQQILRRAEEQRNRFYTSSRDAEKSTLTEPREAVEQLRRRLEEATARRDGIAADADDLDRLRAAERDLAGRVAAAEQRLQVVRDKAGQASDLGRRLELFDEQVRTSESDRQRCSESLQAVKALHAQAERLGTRTTSAAGALEKAVAERSAAQQAYDEASGAATEADGRHRGQEAQVLDLRRRRELDSLRRQEEQRRARLSDAARVAERITAIQQELAGQPRVRDGDVERLRQAQETRDAARARLEGASATLELEAHRDLEVSGERLAGGDTRRLLVEDERRLEVTGVLSITVRAGGGELPKLRDALNDAERDLAGQLDSLGVADLAQAERTAGHRRKLDAELERARLEMKHHLPEGRDDAQARLRELQTRLQDAGAPDLAPVSDDMLAHAEKHLRQASAHREELRARRDVASDRLASAREALASRKAELASLERQRDEIDRRRNELPEAAELEARLAETERTWKQRVAAREDLEERFGALGGEDLELDLEQAEQACRQLTTELQQVRVRCAGLEARLEAAGDDGRHEQVQDLTAELVHAEAELVSVQGQAAAARRLHDVLVEEYENARERLSQPVIARIRPYLASLFPDTEVWLDEKLNLLGLRSRDTDQHFEALSGGAREQLSLLVRIGLAEVVGTDEPWPLVLDDVLVNTDAERIRLVQRLLYQASRHMQILLFTCHGPLFDGLGADARIELPPPRQSNGGSRDEAMSAG